MKKLEDWILILDWDTIIKASLKIGLLILLFIILLPIGKKIISTIISRAGRTDRISNSRVKTLEKLLSNFYFYTLFFIIVIMIFNVLEIKTGPLLAGAGVVGLAIGFGAQGIVSDVVTGFFILLEWQLEIDDYVTIGNVDGIVEEVGLRTTKIRSIDGTLNFIPNRNITTVANHSRGNMRALVDFTMPQTDHIDEYITLLEQVCSRFSNDVRIKDGPHVLGVQSMDTSNLVLRIVAQTENGMQFSCERDIRMAIKEALDQKQQASQEQEKG